MHAVVMDSLEEYLSGLLEPVERRRIEAHLSACQPCREEVGGMQEVSQLFGSLQSEETWDISASFYAGVLERVDQRKAAEPSLASLFGLDFAFARRLAFASLLTLAVLGSYLVSREIEVPGGPSPEAVMAEENSPAFDSAPARDNMLVTLTAYEQH